jgi:hypothetical protein
MVVGEEVEERMLGSACPHGVLWEQRIGAFHGGRFYNIPRFTSFLYYLPHITWLFIIYHILD